MSHTANPSNNHHLSHNMDMNGGIKSQQQQQQHRPTTNGNGTSREHWSNKISGAEQHNGHTNHQVGVFLKNLK